MKAEQDYLRDIAEMRTLMERSTRFLSLAGMAGIMAGLYALAGVWLVTSVVGFSPDQLSPAYDKPGIMLRVMGIAGIVFLLSLLTAMYLSYRKAVRRGEIFWNATSRRLLVNSAIPFLVGGAVILILINKGMDGLVAPMSLVFYGLTLYNAGKYTFEEIKTLGLVQVALGLISAWYIEYGILCWALGFGAAHILYGIYMHYRYER